MHSKLLRLGIFALPILCACGGAAPEYAALHPERVSPALSCTQGPLVSGIDVSHGQGAISWSQVQQDGFQFAFAKATEGVTYIDPEFQTNWSGMKSAGLIRGAYHFFHPQDSGAAQADAYLAQVGALEPGDLPPILDWEVDDCASGDGCPSDDVSIAGCYSIAAQVQSALDFISEIQSRTGLTTIVYTYPYFWQCLGNPSAASAYPLWQAAYPSTATTSSTTPPSGTCPDVLAPWSAWTFWQWSSTGSVSGIATNPTDLDVFNGTLAELQSLAVGGNAGGSGGNAGGTGGSAGGTGGSAGGSGGDAGGTGGGSGGVQCPSGTSDVDGSCVPTSTSGCNTGAPGSELVLGGVALTALFIERRRRALASRSSARSS